MTRKEQYKILDNKIKANNAQYDLDRMNAEISAYSSGDLPKYEYLTKKNLGYKTDAFEQAKFEYLPLGKVFTDGLDKSDKKEGLLKRLKNIEDKSNNQLLAIKNISRPAIKGRNGNGNDIGNGNYIDIYDDNYKKIQNYKKELIDDSILHKNSVEEFDNIINKWIQTKDKDVLYINNENKISTRKLDIYNIFYSYLKKDISYEDIKGLRNNINLAVELYFDENKSIINNSNKVIKGIDLIILLINNDNLRIPGQYYAKPLENTNLSWIKNKDEYKHIADEAGSDYVKGNNDKELKIIKDFITTINNGKINESNAASEVKKLKKKVNNDKLKHDLVKYLQKSLFGEDIESIEPEEKYQESIAERVKTRKQNTQKASAPLSPPKKDYSEETAGYLKYKEEQEKGQKRFSDDYDSNGWSSGSGNVVTKANCASLKILTDKQMFNRLPILLAQIQAGNNSIKLKNEIRQILYSLYRSKLLTKTLYNNLIKSIRQSLRYL